MDRLYCTIAEIEMDLNLPGVKSEESLMRHIRAASQFIEQQLGQFIPRTETLRFNGMGATELLVPPLLAITSITNDGNSLIEGIHYMMSPSRRCWDNGPYSSLVRIDGGYWSSLDEGVVIAGSWGFYAHSEAMGALATSANMTDTTLTVPDGSKCSPGMVLLIDSEQMLVEKTGDVSNSGTELSADATENTEEIAVTDGMKVKMGEVIKIGFEQMKVLDIESNTVLVARGWNESRRANHSNGAQVQVFRTFNVVRGANGTTPATHSNAEVSRLVPPGDVNYLCRQVAALMLKKSQTGFVGRAGNDDLGTGFWVNEFPRHQIEAVRSNYFWPGR